MQIFIGRLKICFSITMWEVSQKLTKKTKIETGAQSGPCASIVCFS